MYVVINGGGQVGSFLARTLQQKGHAVAIIDKRGKVIKKLAEELPTSILLIEGDGCNVRSLRMPARIVPISLPRLRGTTKTTLSPANWSNSVSV